MARHSPLRKLQEQAEAEFIHYGHAALRAAGVDSAAPPVKGRPAPPPHVGPGVDIVASYGEIEAEYAAIRKSAALRDVPQRGLVRITGADRADFLNRMVTNEVKSLPEGASVRAFWLNRKGRIDADLLITAAPDALWVEVDQAVAPHVVHTLSSFVFSEDVQLADVTDQYHSFELFGPAAPAILGSLIRFDAAPADGSDALAALAPQRTRSAQIGSVPVTIAHRDLLHVPGYVLTVPVDSALVLHERILETGLASPAGIRLLGWYAFNIARVESGRPFFLIDFGPDSLPHESGVLREAVSFTKGCYLGQEIVARMEHLGHPSKTLVGLRVTSPALPAPSAERGTPSFPPLPISGAQVFDPADPLGEVIGAVTSATISPMLGGAAIAFAMMKYAKAAPGSSVLVNADDGRRFASRAEAVVTPSLTFWPLA